MLNLARFLQAQFSDLFKCLQIKVLLPQSAAEGGVCVTTHNTTEGHWTIWVQYQAQGITVIANYPPDLKPWVVALQTCWSS